MFHRITLIGFVGQEPQMRYSPDGTPVTNFSVATRQVVSKERVAGCPQGWKESLNGKNWELTTWFRITCWRNRSRAASSDPAADRWLSMVSAHNRSSSLRGGRIGPRAS